MADQGITLAILVVHANFDAALLLHFTLGRLADFSLGAVRVSLAISAGNGDTFPVHALTSASAFLAVTA